MKAMAVHFQVAEMACVTFVLTTSFVFSTPQVIHKSSTGFPIIATLLGQFLFKDVALLAASFTLLDLQRTASSLHHAGRTAK
jgi:uncharacterized membrane protein YkgB